MRLHLDLINIDADTDTDTLMYWIRAYHGCNEYDEKIYLFWRAREWASHVIASSM